VNTVKRRTPLAISVLAAAAVVAAGCGGGSSSPNSNGGGTTSQPTASGSNGSPGGASAQAGGAGCYLHLFDAEGLKKSDGDFKLTKPGRYDNLKNLPGASEDWTDEADSLEVGSAAKVTIWPETNFNGESHKLKPGSKHPSVDSEPSSLTMSC
jgi:hypothetical protein